MRCHLRTRVPARGAAIPRFDVISPSSSCRKRNRAPARITLYVLAVDVLLQRSGQGILALGFRRAREPDSRT